LAIALGTLNARAIAQEKAPLGRAPAKLSEAARLRLQERDRHLEQANRLAESGNLEGGVREAEAALAIDRQVQGEFSEDVAATLGFLAKMHEFREDWGPARKALQDVLALRERQPDPKDWRVREARRALADLERRSSMTPGQRQRYWRARQLQEGVEGLLATGRYEAARRATLQSLQTFRELLGEGHNDYATSLNNLGVFYLTIGDHARAEPLLRQALEVTKRAVGQDSPDFAFSLGMLGGLYRSKRDYVQAELLYRRALESWKKAVGEDNHSYAHGLSDLGRLYFEKGDYGRAEPLLRQALDIQKKTLGENHPEYLTNLNNLGLLYKAVGDYRRAEPLLRQALESRKAGVGEGHPDFAISLNNLGELYRAMGDYRRAEPILRQALGVWKKAVGQDHPNYATSLNNLALLSQANGDYAEAEQLFRQALEVRKKVLGEDHPQYAESLNNLALLWYDKGDYVQSEPLYHRALDILKKALGGEEHPTYAAFLDNLALLYEAIGDTARAEPVHRRALDIRKKVLGASHPDYARSLSHLGWLYYCMGDYPRAEPLLRQTPEILKNAVGRDHPDFAQSLVKLAMLYDVMGDYARAEALLRQALDTQKNTVGEGHPNYADSLGGLSLLYFHMGEYARAEQLLRQALEIQKKAVAEDHPDYASLLHFMGGLCLAQGEYRRAEPWLTEGIERSRARFNDTASALGLRQRLALLLSLRSSLDLYLSVAQENRARAEVLYRRVLDWKGISGALQAGDLLVRDRPELRPVLDELGSVRAQLSHLTFTVPAPAKRDFWRKQLDVLRERKEDLEAELGRRSATYRAGREAVRLGPEDVAASLPAGTALVDMIFYEHYSPPSGKQANFKRERRQLAFVVRRDRPVVCVRLAAWKPIADLTLDWLVALQGGTQPPQQESAAAIGRLIWEPLRPHLADARTILVSPDGLLAFLPFGALPGRKPGSYLIEEAAIGYVGSGREAVALLTAPESTARGGLLAAGAIDFQADPGRAASASSGKPSLVMAARERGGLAPLPGTRAEGQLARDLFHSSFPDQPAMLLTGSEPTEAEVKKRLHGGHWRAVHLGTHGFFELPDRVATLLAGVRRQPPFAWRPDPADDDAAAFPLGLFLNSGVVLAGGGRAPDPARIGEFGYPRDEDGILTAEEVQSLDLRGTELVVLSACQTAIGAFRSGEGVMGLQRAFRAAGARAVVASLWKVDDAATSVLMEQFYTNLWVKKLPKLEALRQAQLAMLKGYDPRRGIIDRGVGGVRTGNPPTSPEDRAAPQYWAAFVLGGDWR
jgi:CHAT domain-containing protein/tetratricopeptide (TPR) repeat protein